jgi:threonine dehydrogenase-like Zn-dependent dehydrogenase
LKALTFHGKQNIHYENIPDPIIEHPLDAIIKVKLSAICGSDLHIYHKREMGLDVGTVMGHEFVGEIIKIGDEVKNFKIGDDVFTPFTTNCGDCFFCKKDLPCRCTKGQLFGWVQNGKGLHGGQAEYVRVPLADSTLIKYTENITPEEALLLGDILSTGYYCADMACINPKGTYVVIGCGPVGLLAIVSAKELGAKTIYAIDSVDYRLEQAKNFGAIPINFKTENSKDLIFEATEKRGADAVLEVVGSANAGRAAFDLVRPGGIISTVGVHTEKYLDFSPVEAYDKNITFKTGRCPARYYGEKLIPLVEKKKYDLSSIISHRMLLRHGVEGYRLFDQKLDNCTKVILTP